MAAATAMTATTTAAMATAEASATEAMPATEASAVPAAKATTSMGKAAVTAERIVMSIAVMVFPIMVVSEIGFIVVATEKTVRVGRVAIARIAIVVISRFATSTCCENE
jgi:hypothetical protein